MTRDYWFMWLINASYTYRKSLQELWQNCYVQTNILSLHKRKSRNDIALCPGRQKRYNKKTLGTESGKKEEASLIAKNGERKKEKKTRVLPSTDPCRLCSDSARAPLVFFSLSRTLSFGEESKKGAACTSDALDGKINRIISAARSRALPCPIVDCPRVRGRGGGNGKKIQDEARSRRRFFLPHSKQKYSMSGSEKR